MRSCRVGVVAASSVVPMVELNAGVARLREAGFSVLVHEQCSRQHFTFAGTDIPRAEALFEYALSPEIDVLWCARGGYGATRILPLLQRMTTTFGRPPRKLIVGYSDVTALHDFTRTHWNWCTLHATMPGAINFDKTPPAQWQATVDWVRGQLTETPWPQPLQFIGSAPAQPIRGELIGGNLTLWACLAGTPYAPAAAGKIVFFEEVGEPWYRIDRMLTQLDQAGMLAGVRAIILGDFKDCRDEAIRALKAPGSDEMAPVRRQFPPAQAMQQVFGDLSHRLGIPVASGLPVGHGPNFAPLPLGAEYELNADGHLRLQHWPWLE